MFLERARLHLAACGNILLAKDLGTAKRLLGTFHMSMKAVLIDLAIAEEDGFELIETVRAMDPDLPIVAISGTKSDSVLQSTMSLGAKATLRKPINGDWIVIVNGVVRKV